MKIYYDLNGKDIKQHSDTAVEFHSEFANFFCTSTESVTPHLLDYLRGQLFLESQRNISRILVEVVNEDERSSSHFLFNSPCEDEPGIEVIGRRAFELLCQGEVSGALILDESGIPKQGTESVITVGQY